MIRVFIADDHVGIRDGIKRILADTTDMCVVGEVGDVQELMTQMAEHLCDVVLLDGTLPGQNGVEVLPWLKQRYPELPVLVCSTYVGTRYVTEAFNAGAIGYLTKDCMPEELVSAIHQVVQGKRYVSPSLANLSDCEQATEP